MNEKNIIYPTVKEPGGMEEARIMYEIESDIENLKKIVGLSKATEFVGSLIGHVPTPEMDNE